MPYATSLKRVALFGLAVALLLWGGCSRNTQVQPPPPAAAPITPIPHGWPSTPADQGCPDRTIVAKGPIAHLGVMYARSNRHFNPDEQTSKPDGYTLWLIPTNQKFQPVQRPSDITVTLYAADRALLTWHIDAAVSNQYWVNTPPLPRYLLRLARSNTTGPPGEYRLAVRITYRHGKHLRTLCGEVTFDDDL